MKIPDKWCVKRTPENYKELNKFFTEKTEIKFSADGTWYDSIKGKYSNDYLHFPKYGNRIKGYEVQPGYTEISFEDFQKYIVEEENKKQNKMTDLKGRKAIVNANAKLKAANYIGQTVDILSGSSETEIIRVMASDGETFDLGGPNSKHYMNEYTLLDENAKIIGYKLLKDMPLIPKDSIFNLEDYAGSPAYLYKSADGDEYYRPETIKTLTDWFSPIYEDVKIEIGGYELNVTNNKTFNFGCKTFTSDDLQSYKKLLKHANAKIEISGVPIDLELLNKIQNKLNNAS